MFYFLSKAFTFLIMPMGLLIVILLIALLTKNRARQRKALIGAILFLFIVGNGFVTNELSLWWEVPPAVLPVQEKPRVGVVLTGGMVEVDALPRQRVYLANEADRMGQALQLYKTGQIQKILISGGIGGLIKRDDVGDEGQLVREFLLIAGVPAQDILLENRSRNTHENALFSAPVLQKQFRGYEYILITSAWHMRRAIGCFRKQNIPVTPYPAAIMAGPREFTPGHLLVPSEKALLDFYWLLHEFFGYAAYRVAGYI